MSYYCTIILYCAMLRFCFHNTLQANYLSQPSAGCASFILRKGNVVTAIQMENGKWKTENGKRKMEN